MTAIMHSNAPVRDGNLPVPDRLSFFSLNVNFSIYFAGSPGNHIQRIT